jgi:glycosyltransferase involved in cell wall biosynthesis
MRVHPGSPLVSIITPSFNQVDYIEDAILSVLAQDYPSIEYGVVDGGSTDGSVELIEKYAHQLAWWVSEPDEGQAAAINKGMERANGEIVAWLNSDDLLMPGAVEQAVKALMQDPELGFVYGDALSIDGAGSPIGRLKFADWDFVDLLSFRIICQPAVFMQRDCYVRAGGLEPGYHFMLDHHLWIRIAQLARIKYVPLLWAAARHHDMAKNVAQATGFGRETMHLLDWMKNQADFAPVVARNRRRVQGGAQRLNARYLLDGEEYADALKAYGRAFLDRPAYTLQHWRRILYALLGSVGGMQSALKPLYRRWQQRRRVDQAQLEGLENWPGLSLK